MYVGGGGREGGSVFLEYQQLSLGIYTLVLPSVEVRPARSRPAGQYYKLWTDKPTRKLIESHV